MARSAEYDLRHVLYGPRDSLDPQTSYVISTLIKRCVDAARSGSDQIEV